VIRQGVVSPDPRRIETILNNPAPRNQRRLRQFLGTANYHCTFSEPRRIRRTSAPVTEEGKQVALVSKATESIFKSQGKIG
jgi:hypothetical protein